MESLKQRIFTNWTFTRALYLGMGFFIIYTSVSVEQWFGIALGVYFASMGLFAFGCAGGSCYTGSRATESKQAYKQEIDDVDFEELKAK